MSWKAGIATLALATAAATSAGAQTNVLFIFDASGSMKRDAGSGESRIAVARRAVTETLRAMPPSARLGLMAYGHRSARNCRDIELVAPIASEDASTLGRMVGGLDPRGETPIADALLQAGKSFAAFKRQSNRIVLVTDGIEECGGDPCEAAQTLAGLGVGLKVDVVGFGLDEAQSRLIRCVPATTGGRYYDAGNPGALRAALSEVRTAVAQAAVVPPPPPPPPPAPIAVPVDDNLLSAKNGGQILTAPNAAWLATVDGSEKPVEQMIVGQSGVFGFKDGRQATFDNFGVFIGGEHAKNPRELEISIGDDGPTGTFTTVGTFTVQNTQFVRSPYQQIRFPAVTARYVKVKVLANHGYSLGYTLATEFRVTGTLGSPDTAAVPAPGHGDAQNLLSAKNGGQILTAPNKAWLATNDDSEKPVEQMVVGQEAVYAFRGDQPARFDNFGVFIGAEDAKNPRQIEVLVGDDSPTGAFTSVGKLALHNTKVVKEPYQELRFPIVSARFVKVRITANHGYPLGYTLATEFRIMGRQ
jgi:hypothetical protein